MIELKLNTGEDVLLTPILKEEGVYELVDIDNIIHMTMRLSGSIFIITNNVDVIEDADSLREKLNSLAIRVIESSQSEVEDNEFNQSEIAPYNPDDIKVHQKQFSIKFIEEMIDNQDIDFTPDFQRNFVWNSVQKSLLIESLLLRIPLPIFYFAEDYDGRLTIVDGLQRLTTIKEFMNNEFQLRNLEYLSEGVKGRYYKSDPENGKKGIDAKYYRWFNMTQFSVNVIDPVSPHKAKYDIFRRINTGGRPLNNQEIRNCLATKNLRNLLKAMVNLPEFITATDGSLPSTRMADMEIAIRFIAFYEAYKSDNTLVSSYDGYMETFLDDSTEKFAKLSENDHNKFLSLFSNAMKNAEYLFGAKYAFRKVQKEHINSNHRKQLFNKALFIGWSVLLADIPFKLVEEKYERQGMLKHFANELESDPKLMYFLSYGTNGKANLEYVFQSINSLKNKYLPL